jgi:CBS domain containing-hemolysin-like protein
MMPLFLFALGILASAFFSAVETAMVSVNRTRLSHRADSGDAAAARTLRFLEDPRRLFGATLVGNNLANVFAATLATLWFGHRFGEASVPWVVLGLTALLLVVGEIVPKSIARAQADRLTILLTGPLESFDAAMRPLVLAVTGASTALLRLFGVKTSPTRGAMSRQDFQLLLDESEETGQVAPGQGRILSRVLDFGETTVAEVMRPRTDIVAVETGTLVREAIEIVERTGFTRIPAYRGNPDQIVGFVHLFDLLKTPGIGLPVDGLLRPIGFVPEGKPCDELLREMRARHRPIMVVVDEYGGTAGIVTIEDLVEELVGDIKNEEETAHVPLKRMDSGRWQADATMRVFDVNEALDTDLPEGDYETLGGLVIERLGRIPNVGDVVQVGGVRIEVLAADQRRVRQVAITKVARGRRAP